MHGVSAKRILLLATAAASLGWGQAPVINNLQVSYSETPPSTVQGITSGSNLPNGFTLYINGVFHVNNFLAVKWSDPSTNVTTTFPAASVSATTAQIVVTIPFALFSTLVAIPVTVTVSVQETGGTASAPFLINPPLQALGPLLPAGTVTQAYSANLVTGGTAPFTSSASSGLPPGVTVQDQAATAGGVPTQVGVFSFAITAGDFWGNSVSADDTIQIVDVPTIQLLSPNSSGSGAGNLTVTVVGTNFVDTLTVGNSQQPGSQVQWKVGAVLTPLATTFVNSGQLTAVIPSALLATPANAGVAVQQPSPASSTPVQFTVSGPTISTIVPTGVPAGSQATTLIVNGANFVANAATSAVSTVSLNGVALLTTYVNSGTLSAAVPASMLNSPIQYTVQVTNPGGAASNTVPFFVLAPGISSLSVASVPAGSPDSGLTLTGVNYLSGSQVLFRGSTLSAGFVNSTTLTVTLPSSLLTTPGSFNIQVVNPGGTQSNSLGFTVLGPTLAFLSRTSIPVGSSAFPLSVTGANFVSGSQVIFNGTLLQTTFGSSTTLSTTVPANLVAAAGRFDVKVQNPGGARTADLPFNVLSPVINSLVPASIPAGSAAFTLTIDGANFVPGSQVLFDGIPVSTSSDGSTSLSATVPAALVAAPKQAAVVVLNSQGAGGGSAAAFFNVIGSLAITTTSLPASTSGSNYTAVLTGTGGKPPYNWTVTGLPAALAVNSATGVIGGILLAGGTFSISVVLQDSVKSAVSAQFSLVVGPPPVSISASSSLPSGVVGVKYSGFVAANGGVAPYTFSVGGGKLPDGLTFSSGGVLSGTPITPGTFNFSVVVTDSTGATGSRDFTVKIEPAPLNITGGPTSPVPVGSPISIAFTATGGIAPYRFTPCALPPGTSFSNGTLSGTPTTVGNFTVCLTLADSTNATVTKSFTLTVIEPPPPAPLTLSGTLIDGKVGVAYSGQITASGGTGPYSFSGSGLPDGLSISTSGAISGTPGSDGQFSFTVTANDSKGATGNGTFRITVAPADLAIITSSLPDGQVGVAYSASLNASGGIKPYTWTASGLPDGVTATSQGVLSGTPKTPGKFTVNVSVTDAAAGSVARTRSYSVTIVPAALVITTTSVPNGTVGAPYNASITASGGATPLTFSATGLPAGLTISAAGVISGTPTAPGAATIVVTVRDAAGATISKNFAVTIVLPATPPLSLTGISDTAGPLQQPRIQVKLGSSFPVDVVVTLTLTFAPDNGFDDPSIQFSTGGRTARITVPAGSTNGATDVGVQTGSVAGVITITTQMQAAGQDITPSPAPRQTIRIAAAAPVIVPGSITAVRNSTGFNVTLSGYVTDREMTQAVFVFTPAAGSNLQTTTLTVSIDSLFAQYFSSPASAATGSQFTFTQPFTVTGSTQAIASVTVTLVNRIGQSAAASATLN